MKTKILVASLCLVLGFGYLQWQQKQAEPQVLAAQYTPPPEDPPPADPPPDTGGGSQDTSQQTTTTTQSAPSTSSSSTSSSSSSKKTSTSSSSSTAAPADTTSPTISNFAVSEVGLHSATITWTTNEAAEASLDCGETTKYGYSDTKSELATTHKFKVVKLKPLTLYHCQARNADAAHNAVTGADQTFTTLGYSVEIKVVDGSDKIVANANVTLGKETKVTNVQGIVSFSSVKDGSHVIKVVAGDKKVNPTIKVADDESKLLQKFEVKLDKESKAWWLWLAGTAAGLLLLFIWWKLRKRGGSRSKPLSKKIFLVAKKSKSKKRKK